MASGDANESSMSGIGGEDGGRNVLTASELASADSRIKIKGAKAVRRSPSKDSNHSVALRKALTKDRHQSKGGKGRGAPKKGKSDCQCQVAEYDYHLSL